MLAERRQSNDEVQRDLLALVEYNCHARYKQITRSAVTELLQHTSNADRWQMKTAHATPPRNGWQLIVVLRRSASIRRISAARSPMHGPILQPGLDIHFASFLWRLGRLHCRTPCRLFDHCSGQLRGVVCVCARGKTLGQKCVGRRESVLHHHRRGPCLQSCTICTFNDTAEQQRLQ